MNIGANKYIICEQRKTQYKLQQYGLVLTYEDDKNGQWHLRYMLSKHSIAFYVIFC